MDYEATRAKAARDIRANGKPVTLRLTGSAAGWTYAYDPALGKDTWTRNVDPFDVVYVDPATPIDYAAYAVELPQNSVTLWNVKTDELGIQVGDFFLMLAALDNSGAIIPLPRPEHSLYIGSVASGQRVSIVGARALIPGTVPLFYEVHCRG